MPAQISPQQSDNRPGSASGANLNLKIEDVLQLQHLEDPERGRYHVKVIGLYEGIELIVTAPQANGNLLLLREGQQFIVRSLSGRQVVGFNAEVMKVYMNPYPYVHLRIPGGRLEHFDVRNAYRVDVSLIAAVKPLEKDLHDASQVVDNQKITTVSVVDISTSGCQLRSSTELDPQLTHISLSVRIDVAQQVRTIQIPAEICSAREVYDEAKDSFYHLYGVKFEEMEDDKRLVLYCYVYEQIALEMYSD